MEHDDRREIFERLEALERLVRSRSGEHGRWDEHPRGGHDRHDHGRDDRGRGPGDGEFQEKRIIDTIVQLVGERLERCIQDQQAKTQRRDEDGGEKRVVDLVVRLVSERVREIVQEIVSTELDRRLGRPGGNPPSPEPEER
jgi:hypothetical protein